MKNVQVDVGGFSKKVKKQKKKLIFVLLAFIFLFYIALAYFSLMPRENAEMKAKRDAREAELNIKFDKKLLERLSNAGETIEVYGSGQKNPFLSY